MDAETLALLRAVEDGKITDGRAVAILAAAAREISAALDPAEILRRQGEYYREKNKDLDTSDYSTKRPREV